MITTEMLATEKSNAMAIENKDAILPNMPIKDFLQEAGNLIAITSSDKNELLSANLDWNQVLRLEPAIEVLRDAQTELMEQRKEDEEARAQWRIEYPKAEALKADILKAMRFVYDGDERALNRVSEIAAGSGYNDTIMDLHDCAVKGKKDISRFKAINYPVENFDDAEKLSNSLMLLLGRMNGESSENSQVKLNRDKAYTNLKAIVEYIRKYGKYVFRNDSDKSERYTCNYFKH